MSRMRQKRKARGEAERAAEAERAGGDEQIEAAGDDEAEVDGEIEVSEIVTAAATMPEGEAEDEADPDADLEPVRGISPARLKTIVESLLFAADKPLTLLQIRQLTGERNMAAIQAALDALIEDYRDRGIVLGQLAGGFQFRTHPTSAEYVQRLIAGRPVRLSRAQLETLAIIAYRQPVTRPEIDEIRGVDCGSTLKVLLYRSLIRVLGKKEEPGRPLLYGTSKDFLEFFNLRDLRDLPTLREFHELSEESMRMVEKLDAEDSPEEASEPAAGGREEGGAGDDSADAAAASAG
jgi:segregation and condensation protein B